MRWLSLIWLSQNIQSTSSILFPQLFIGGIFLGVTAVSSYSSAVSFIMSFSNSSFSEYKSVCSELGFYPDGTTRYPISEWEAIKLFDSEFPEIAQAIEQGQLLKDAKAERRAKKLANSAARCVIYTGGLALGGILAAVVAPATGLVLLAGALAAGGLTLNMPEE